MQLKDFVKQGDFNAPRAVVEVDADTRSALSDFINQARNGDRTPGAKAAPGLREWPFAHEIANAVRDKARQFLRHPLNGVTGQVQAERVALACQAQRLAPFGLERGGHARCS